MTMKLAESLLPEAPVVRMISLLTSNTPDLSNSACLSSRIDTDDFHDRELVSLTM
jgi:hypothetical protein